VVSLKCENLLRTVDRTLQASSPLRAPPLPLFFFRNFPSPFLFFLFSLSTRSKEKYVKYFAATRDQPAESHQRPLPFSPPFFSPPPLTEMLAGREREKGMKLVCEIEQNVPAEHGLSLHFFSR